MKSDVLVTSQKTPPFNHSTHHVLKSTYYTSEQMEAWINPCPSFIQLTSKNDFKLLAWKGKEIEWETKYKRSPSVRLYDYGPVQSNFFVHTYKVKCVTFFIINKGKQVRRQFSFDSTLHHLHIEPVFLTTCHQPHKLFVRSLLVCNPGYTWRSPRYQGWGHHCCS